MPVRFLKGLTPARMTKLWYLPLLAFGMGLMFLRLLIMARLLSLPEFAVYSSGILISSSFLMLACFGLHSMLQRELPVMIVRKRERTGMVLVAQCVVVAVACACAGATIVWALSISLAGVSPGMVVLGLLHGLSQQFFLIATTESRSRGEPVRYSRDNLYRSLLLLLSGTLVAYFTRQALHALLVESIGSLLISLILLRNQLPRTKLTAVAVIRLALLRFKSIKWPSAFTLLTVGILAFVMLNADRWLAAQWLTPVHFAQYAFAWTVLMAAQSAQVMINASLYPMIARRFANSGSATAFKMSALASLVLLLVGALFALPVWVTLDYAIQRWYPAYAEARSLLAIFLVVAVLRFSDYWSTYLVIVGKEVFLLLMNLAVISTCFSLWWMVFRPSAAGMNLAQAALFAGMLAVAAYFGAALLAFWINHRATHSASE